MDLTAEEFVRRAKNSEHRNIKVPPVRYQINQTYLEQTIMVQIFPTRNFNKDEKCDTVDYWFGAYWTKFRLNEIELAEMVFSDENVKLIAKHCFPSTIAIYSQGLIQTGQSLDDFIDQVSETLAEKYKSNDEVFIFTNLLQYISCQMVLNSIRDEFIRRCDNPGVENTRNT